ncbi:MAG: CDP-glycerol glycerophosphotransferase family protein [Candidatus Neomarinimicrobiota bacterium]
MPILEPIQDYIDATGIGVVRWFAASSARKVELPGEQLKNTPEVIDYNPDAVIVPGNVVPHFWPGLKVQIFHGLGEDKKGHYRITGFFDLYCTPGPFITSRFEALARRHHNFLVRETGWPKLDRLVNPPPRAELKKQMGFAPDLPLILYAPTFSPKYSSAGELAGAIGRLQGRPWQWLIKFHDLMDKSVIENYRKLESGLLRISTDDDIIPLLQATDVLVSDTSSVTYEYLMLDRPIITYRAAVRTDQGINIFEPLQLEAAVESALTNPAAYQEQRKHYLNDLHPYRDGQSSRQVLEAIEWALDADRLENLRRKPLNLLRKRQIRKIVSW